MHIKDKVVWITGASSGIGEALAYKCAGEGAKIALSARRENELIRVARNCKVPSKDILIVPIDLEKTMNVQEQVEDVIQKFGRIDILINNGGIGHRTKAVNTSTAIDRKIMEVNFFGTINLTKAVSKVMQQQKAGKIVVISSIMGKHGWPLYSTYCASKHAINGYFESLRHELFNDNISVLIVSPGYIRTGIASKFLLEDGKEWGIKPNSTYGMSPDECAKIITKAIEKDKDHKFIGGREIFSMYVKQYFPRYFYKKLRRRGI